MPSTRAQQDVARALQDVSEALEALGGDARRRYGVCVQRLPVMIRENGLLAAFGFLHAKAGGTATAPEGLLARQLAEALGLGDAPQAVEQRLADLELGDYLRQTRRCLDLLIWYKRQVEARLGAEVTHE